jgi:hypothetical protein
MSKLWASSPNDVYAIGHCSSPEGQLYHYDGNSWTHLNLFQYTGVPYSIYGIFGFSLDDVYIVGKWNDPLPPNNDNSFIIHFNGSTWDKIDIPHRARLNGIWGSAPNDLWVGGNDGTMIHYDGNAWDIDSLPHPGYPDLEFNLYANHIRGESKDKIRASSYSVFAGANTLYHTFIYSNGEWAIEDSSWQWELSARGFWVSPEGNWYKGTNKGLFKLQGSTWNPMMSEEMLIFGIHGTSDNNIFVCGQIYDTYYVKHFNGSDWFTYDALIRRDDEQVYRDIFTINGEVFVAGYTIGAWPQKSIILHGK